jgi:hypothetical protein
MSKCGLVKTRRFHSTGRRKTLEDVIGVLIYRERAIKLAEVINRVIPSTPKSQISIS